MSFRVASRLLGADPLSSWRALWLVGIAGLLAAACGRSEMSSGLPLGTIECTACHGSGEDPAPPVSLAGGEGTEDLGVGAHQSHLRDGEMRAALPCESCHRVPDRIQADGHIDPLPAELAWSDLAKADGAAPEWDRELGTCTDVYCHGATLSGGSKKTPVWTKVGQGEAACGTCHGDPPPPPHPKAAQCSFCHGRTVGSDGKIDILQGRHIDGVVQAPAEGCSGCHGSEESPAPPVALNGDANTTSLGVGAHQAHLRGGKLREGLPCGSCHRKPEKVDDPGHLDDPPADLKWSALATTGGVAPQWDRSTATCADTYCHGATLAGGENKTPVWTKVGQGEAACGTCHGDPPPPPHPQAESCASCHPGTVLGPDLIDVAGGLHINGTVEAPGSECNACHGSASSDAPPKSVEGFTATTAVEVGAHQAHLKDGALRAALACEDCHEKPDTVEDAGHIDMPPAELKWSALATTGGVAPEWDRSSATCTNVYCHGATLSGGGNKTPAWTKVGQGEAACGTCHGDPPPPPHPQAENCASCHPGTVLGEDLIDVAGGLHINGTVEAPGSECNACHGSASSDAPPKSVEGFLETSAVEVGAHQAHLDDGALRKALACEDCHETPESVEDAGHIDMPPAELTWGVLARGIGLDPKWDRASATCTNVYCHGATVPGGSHKTPIWTKVGQGEASCGTCHGNPPPEPHPQMQACSLCHRGTVLPSGVIDVAGGLHIDGITQKPPAGCIGCHGSAVSGPAPPVALDGSEETSALGVGAHQAHMKGGEIRAGLPCGSCHEEPITVLDPGHFDPLPADIRWSDLAKTGNLEPEWDRSTATCTNVYCHGATLPGGSNKAPTWTKVGQGEAACGTCHGDPPPLPHPQASNCASCHPGTALGPDLIDLAGGLHINGKVEGPGPWCNGCHGSAGSPAPPKSVEGFTATTAVEVGAHEAHLSDGELRKALACEDCHKKPGAVGDAGHVDLPPAELSWGPLATTGGLVPAWDRSTATCTNVYCHGATVPGGSNDAPTWTKVGQGEAACGTCHGDPPPLPHPQASNCASCHPGTVLGPDLIDVAGGLHINGTVEAPGSECNACHGSASSDAPPKSVEGFTATTAVEVGAHEAHLLDGDLRKALACEDCHKTPGAVGDAGHVDLPPAELSWGPLATTGGLAPIWDRSTATCTNVYCHGATVAGGSNEAPTWTKVGQGEADCGTCHGNPPPAPHPQMSNCNLCHAGTVLPSGAIDLAGGLHIDGLLQIPGPGCTDCHGSAANAAPPAALGGVTGTASLGVGAHQAHLSGGTMRQGLPCTSCHEKPVAVLDPGHLDPLPADMSWSALATTGGLAPLWDRSTATCTNVYCHGATLSGGSNSTPTWTKVDQGQAACGTCHGNPPDLPHPQVQSCNLCHPGTVLASGAIDLAGGKHVNGSLEKSASGCSGCHAAPPATGAHLVHYAAASTTAKQGDTRGTAEILPGGGGYAFGCGNCHPTDLAQHANGVGNAGGGTAQVDLSPAGASPGSLKSLNPPTAKYTPGNAVLVDAQGHGYTLGTCSDVYCHSSAEVSVPGPVPVPGVDFPFTGYPITYPAYTVDRFRVYATPSWGDVLDCASCHGFPPRTFAPSVAAAAGDSHSWIDAAGSEHLHTSTTGASPMACATCHYATVQVDAGGAPSVDPATLGWAVYQPIPISGYGRHVNGQPDILFTPDLLPGTSPPLDLSGAGYAPLSRTCTDVACHLKDTEAVWGRPYRPGLTLECNACHQK